MASSFPSVLFLAALALLAAAATAAAAAPAAAPAAALNTTAAFLAYEEVEAGGSLRTTNRTPTSRWEDDLH
jgi:hypothetical protein